MSQPFNLVAHCIGVGAQRHPDRTALIELGETDTRWSYAELDAAVRAVGAGLLDLGLPAGSPVVLRLGNSGLTPIAFLAAMAVGLLAVPTSHLLTAAEAEAIVLDCCSAGVGAVVLADDLPVEVPQGVLRVPLSSILAWSGRGRQADYAATGAEQPAYLTYTSGTESRPKGVLHAHRSLLGRAPMHDWWQGLRPEDVLLHAGALSWTYTLGVGLLDPWSVGATAVVYTGPRHRDLNRDGTWWRLIDTSGATIFAAVPGVYRQLLDGTAPASTARLRHGLVAGEALTPELWRRWNERTGLGLYEALGMSEISTFVSSAPPVGPSPGVPTLLGSPGKPQPGRRVAVLPLDGGTAPVPDGTHGVLAVHRSDPGLMLGYLNRPEEQAAAFRADWFVSADVVHLDQDGYLHHHGRADDVITAGGYRVSPQEVEAVLEQHPAVVEAAVVERPVRPGVSIIRAVVVAVRTVEADDELADALLAHAAEQLADFKCPKEVVFAAGLPRTGNGKLQRAALRQ